MLQQYGYSIIRHARALIIIILYIYIYIYISQDTGVYNIYIYILYIISACPSCILFWCL